MCNTHTPKLHCHNTVTALSLHSHIPTLSHHTLPHCTHPIPGCPPCCRFEVILRNVEQVEGPAAVEAAAEELRCSGFINYFGLQRFGSGAVPTHRWVGKRACRGKPQTPSNMAGRLADSGG